MPIYEYRCENCGHELEAIQKISDEPLKHCPSCDTDNLVKRVSAAGFRLKGGGWYETDFKSGKKRNVAGDKAGTDGAASSSSGGGDASSTSSKDSGASKSSAGGESKTAKSKPSTKGD